MARPDELWKVPRAQLSDAYRFCLNKIEEERRSGKSLNELAMQFGIKPSALKQFVSRGKNPSADLRRGKAFADIFEHLSKTEVDMEALSPPVTAAGNMDLSNLSAIQIGALSYKFIRKALKIDEGENAARQRNLSGVFHCYRMSTIGSYIVKSILVISEKLCRHGDAIWEFCHAHVDSSGSIKSSDGMFLSLGSKVYLIGDIETGRGVEFIVLNDNKSDNVRNLTGFEISTDHEGITFFSRLTCIKQEASVDLNYLSEEFLTKNTGAVLREVVGRQGILGNRQLGLSVLKFLEYDDGKSAFQLHQGAVISQVVEQP